MPSSLNPGRYRRAERYIARHVGRLIRSGEMAAAIGISTNELGPVLRWHRLAGRLRRESPGLWLCLPAAKGRS